MSKTKTAPLSELVATSAPLRAWLESLPPDEVAGTPVAAKDCPIARLLHERGWATGCVGTVLAYSTPAAEDGAPLCASLAQFRRLVDSPRRREPLTAKRCLALLKRAEREVRA